MSAWIIIGWPCVALGGLIAIAEMQYLCGPDPEVPADRQLREDIKTFLGFAIFAIGVTLAAFGVWLST